MPGSRILDVGASLRVDERRGNFVDPSRVWMKPLVAQLEYVVMDPVDTFHPDVVGDIMQAPFPDAAFDGVICLAVLEHVPRAWDAVREMHRILKPGGVLLGYVPFLSPYHAMPGYYGDYVRFTEDGVKALCSAFSHVEVVGARGLAQTLVYLLPSKVKFRMVESVARRLDQMFPGSGKQMSGYYFYCTK